MQCKWVSIEWSAHAVRSVSPEFAKKTSVSAAASDGRVVCECAKSGLQSPSTALLFHFSPTTSLLYRTLQMQSRVHRLADDCEEKQ